MIRMGMFLCVGLCLAVVGAAVSAYAQSNAEAPADTNPAIDAVDASVHPEVDGQPHEPTPEESSGERPAALHAAKRPPTTVVWPAHAEVSTTKTDDKGVAAAVTMSSFRPRKESEPASAVHPNESTASGSVKKDDSSKSHAEQPNTAPSHSSGYAKTSSTLKTTVPAIPDSGQTPALGAAFERPMSGLAASTEPFPKKDPFKYKDQSNAKRHHHARKPMTNSATKSPHDTLTTTRH